MNLWLRGWINQSTKKDNIADNWILRCLKIPRLAWWHSWTPGDRLFWLSGAFGKANRFCRDERSPWTRSHHSVPMRQRRQCTPNAIRPIFFLKSIPDGVEWDGRFRSYVVNSRANSIYEFGLGEPTFICQQPHIFMLGICRSMWGGSLPENRFAYTIARLCEYRRKQRQQTRRFSIYEILDLWHKSGRQQ